MSKLSSGLLGALLVTSLLTSSALDAQVRTVTGQVVGDANQPLTTVIVQVVGTSYQALTNLDGRFTIQAPAGEVTLRFQNFGLATQDVVLSGGTNTVQVSMAYDVLNIGGIVVTGQSTTVSRRMTTAAAPSKMELSSGHPSVVTTASTSGMFRLSLSANNMHPALCSCAPHP